MFDLDGQLEPQQLELLERLTERYCVVYQTLISSPAVSMTIQTGEHPGAI